MLSRRCKGRIRQAPVSSRRSWNARISFLVITVLCATLLITAFALAADADGYEPDDSSGAASPLAVGAAAQQHTIAPAGDQDWVSFSVSAGEMYLISTMSGTPVEDLDVDLYLYDSDGSTLLKYNEDWGPDALIEYTATADKTVYAQVIGDDGGATGTYAISVVLATDGYEPDGSYSSATPLIVDAPAQQHTIYPDDDEDWVSFPVSTGRVYRIRTAAGIPADDIDTRLSLYDSDGTTQLDYRDDTWLSPDELIEYTATANKTLYVRVQAWDSGAYALRVELVGDSYEPDGSAATANPIPVGGAAQQHTLDPYGDQDWVSFDVVAGLTYRVSSGRAGLEDFTRVVLFDSDGTTELLTYDDAYVDYKADADKTVFARITGYFADEGEQYDVSVVVISDDYEPDDSYSAAKPITVNGAVQQHSLLPAGEEDWVSFPVTRGWLYTIETAPGTSPEDPDTVLVVYDSDGMTEIVRDDDGGEGSYSRIDYIAETSRTLYARVTAYGWSDSTYALSVTAVPIPLISVTESLDFGTVAVGGSLQKTITISNVGAAPLVIGDVELVGADFSVVSENPSGETIAPDESRDVVVEYSPTVAYSGGPFAVKKSWTSTFARYNYVGGSLYSISLFTGFENLGGSGDLPWHVRVRGVDSTGSGAVVAGGKYIMEVIVSHSNASGLVDVLQPVTQGFNFEEDMLGSFMKVVYIRVPDASLNIASNAANEPEVTAGMFGTAGVSANTAPVAADDFYEVNEDQTLGVEAPGYLLNDTDAEGDPLTISWRTEPTHGHVSPDAAGAIAYWPDRDFNGTDSFSYRVTDGQLESNIAVITITVNPVNDEPVLAPIGDKGGVVGVPITFTATATDVDLPANTLTFSLDAGAPAGAAIDPATGAFTWTPAATGSFPVTVIVSDGTLTDSETVTITVSATNAPPVLAPIGPQSVNELTQLSFTATATDPDGDTLTFTLGAGAPAGATITPAGDFTFTPTEAQGPSTPTVRITVSDGKGGTDSEDIVITVGEVNVAPVLAAIGDKGGVVGVPITFTVSATDADLPANTLTYSLTSAPSGAAITAGGLFTFTPAAIGSYPVTVSVSDGKGGTHTDTFTITVTDAPLELTVTPVAGAGRVETAIEASKLAFAPGSSDHAVIATARAFPDALGGSALAGVLHAPILLVEPTSLSPAVAAEIARLGASHVIVLGGTGAVSQDVYDALEALPGVSCERIFGANRYTTAEAVAARVIAENPAWDGTAFVATGESFPDALGASPLAAAKGWPIYLVHPNAANHPALVATMQNAGVTDVLILGGTGVVPASLESQLNTAFGDPAVTRLAGADRYATAVTVATYGVEHAGLSFDKLAIATGENFPDALSGGALQGRSGSVMLLTHTAYLDTVVKNTLTDEADTIFEVRFLGGTGAVSTPVRTAVTQILEK